MTDVAQARRNLGARLRDLRKDAGLSGRTLAEQAGWNPSKVSRFEKGHRSPSEDDLRQWCRLTSAPLALPDLIASVRNIESAYLEWRRILAAGVARRQHQSADLEVSTRWIRGFEPDMIPGLLQTRAYATAVLAEGIALYGGIDDLAAAIEARLSRQRVLHHGDHRIALLLGEQALYTTAGGSGVMIEQLEHLLEVMRLPRLSLGVIPARAVYVGAHNFAIYDQRQALVETISAELTVTQPQELVLYETVFATLADRAVYGSAARSLIESALQELR